MNQSIIVLRRLLLIASVVTGLAPAILVADDVSNEEEALSYRAPDKAEMSYFNRISSSNHWEEVHKKWSSTVLQTAERLDEFFADDRLDEEGNRTRIKLTLGIRLKEGKDPDVIRRISARLSLPKLDQRVQLVLNDIAESEDPSTTSDALRDISDTNPDASIRYNVRKKRRTSIDADAGVRLGGTSQVFGRLRGSRTFDLSEELNLRWINTVTWYTSDGWVGKTEAQFNRQLASDLLFRSSSEVEWREDTTGVRPSQRFSLYKSYSKRRALRWDIGGTWPEVPDPVDTRYYSSIALRRLVHSNWLYMELSPGVEFTQDTEYDERYFIRIQFEVVLGHID